MKPIPSICSGMLFTSKREFTSENINAFRSFVTSFSNPSGIILLYIQIILSEFGLLILNIYSIYRNTFFCLFVFQYHKSGIFSFSLKLLFQIIKTYTRKQKFIFLFESFFNS